MSIFFAGPDGEMSKSKISMGTPRVMQAFGIWLNSQTEAELEANDAATYIDQASNMPLNRCAAEQKVNLVIVVPYDKVSNPAIPNKTIYPPNRFRYSIQRKVVSLYATVASR